MRIGILADIHEDVDGLRNALRCLQGIGVDQIVVLGDVFDTGKKIKETVQLLADSGAVGVFGNHDLGFCHEPDERLLEKYGGDVCCYMASLRQKLEMEGCLFCHGLPHWEATDPVVYYLAGKPEEDGVVEECFRAVSHKTIIVGHFHRWFIATEDGPLSWDGESRLALKKEDRFLVVVGAVCDGWCAVFDTESSELNPVKFHL